MVRLTPPELEWSPVREVVNHVLRQNPALGEGQQGMVKHLQIVGLADDYKVMRDMPGWKHLEDELRQFDQNLVQQTFEGALKVEEVAMARKVIEAILGLPYAVEQMGEESRRFIRTEQEEGMHP